MKTQSAFWREVLDYIPQLLLLFRIDEQEDAHLIFANREISNQLGYTAKEYVLESEKQSKISRELGKLIDEIARRSHDIEDIKPQPCMLSAKNGEEHRFNIHFRVFSTSSKKSNLILVLLQRVGENEEVEVALEEKYRQESSGDLNQRPDAQNKPIIASPLVQSALQKAQQLFDNSQNILLVGERGVGKKTLAEYLLEISTANIDARVIHRDEIIKGSDNYDEVKRVIIYIPHIENLDNAEQQELYQQLSELKAREIKITCIATSITSLEKKVSEQMFEASLYYELAFSNVLIPPLQQRKEDIKAVTQKFIKDAEQTLHLENLEVGEKQYEKLMHHEWTKNFHELFEVLHESICRAQNDIVEFKLATRKQSNLFPEENIDPEDILPFDEMNRRYLARILEITSGKIYGDDGAASLVDLKPTTLQSKLKKLGLR